MSESKTDEPELMRTYWGNRRTFEDIVRRQLAWVVTFTGIGAAATVTLAVLALTSSN